jgi:16S rRNA (cytosine1402-N4)-methyltransferase
MDRGAEQTAATWLQRVPEAELARVLFEYGGERHSRRIARAIVAARQRAPLRRTGELAELIRRALPPPARRQRIHPATRSFQAIRMVVNDELGELERGLAAAWACLRPGGRLAVIAFHSHEDRQAKVFLRARGQLVTKKPIVASPAEVRRNPRARSAHLRCAIVPEAAS